MEKVRYVEAVRKIFDSTHSGAGFEKCCALAAASSYKALTFNGEIFVLGPTGWVKSPFTIQDFEV